MLDRQRGQGRLEAESRTTIHFTPRVYLSAISLATVFPLRNTTARFSRLGELVAFGG